MKLGDLLNRLDVLQLRADPETEITGISFDSRRTVPGDLFVAVRGFETDGHLYLSQALRQGASALLCETLPDSGPYILVPDSRLALAQVSCAFYGDPASEMRMIGVTGTSGKTTVTTLLSQVLHSASGAKVGLIGTNGIFIGDETFPSAHTTPESCDLQHILRRMADCGCTHDVMEVSSHALTLHRVAGIRYNTAVYTNLSQDHLDFHGSMDAYAAAKRELFAHSNKACMNADDPWTPFMEEGLRCPSLRYGLGESSALRAVNPRFSPNRVNFDALYEGRRIPISLGMPGTFTVQNGLAVLAACLCEGIAPEAAAEALSTVRGPKGRLETVPTGGDWTLVIDYSHKPDALEKVLQSLRPSVRGRLICLFGCGGDRDRLKRPVMGRIAGDLSDLVILTSDNPRTEDPEAILDEIEPGLRESGTPWLRICDRESAIHRAIGMAQPGDVLLLAGKGHETYQVVGREKRPMDERAIAAEALRRKRNGR